MQFRKGAVASWTFIDSNAARQPHPRMGPSTRNRKKQIESVIKRFIIVVFCLTMGSASHALAEGGCPPGQVPQQGQGWQSCVPIPGSTQGAGGQSDGSLWQNSWQAIATDNTRGVLGSAIEKISRQTAEDAAMNDCRTKGGTDCQLRMSYGNGCMAAIVGAKLLHVQVGNSKTGAEKKGMEKCNAEDSKCVVYYSECSKAIRIQ